MVPYKYKELLEKDEMYPAGWCHRKFFAPRRSVQSAKQARTDGGLVDEVIKEQQRLDEAARQVIEDNVSLATGSGGEKIDM